MCNSSSTAIPRCRPPRAAPGAEHIAVEPPVFDLLVLVQNRKRVVSKDDLIALVWAGRIVSGSALTSRINAARKAVGKVLYLAARARRRAPAALAGVSQCAQPPLRRAVDHSTTRVGLRATGRDTL